VTSHFEDFAYLMVVIHQHFLLLECLSLLPSILLEQSFKLLNLGLCDLYLAVCMLFLGDKLSNRLSSFGYVHSGPQFCQKHQTDITVFVELISNDSSSLERYSEATLLTNINYWFKLVITLR